MDDIEKMYREGCERRMPQKLSSGDGYAAGGRVAMNRMEGMKSGNVQGPIPGKISLRPSYPANSRMPSKG